jgi:hypothetical protein
MMEAPAASGDTLALQAPGSVENPNSQVVVEYVYIETHHSPIYGVH